MVHSLRATGVVVIDRRPAVRDFVANAVEGAVGYSVVANVSDAAELRAVNEIYGLLVVGEADEPAQGWSSFAVSIHRLGDGLSMSAEFPCLKLASASTTERVGRTRATRLSARERQILAGVVDGRRANETALEMNITPKSVENHKQRIFAKLGVQSQAQAVLAAQESGDLPSGGRHVQGRRELVVLVASPSVLLTEVLTAALNSAPEVQIGVTTSLEGLLVECERLEPDVVLAAARYSDGDLLSEVNGLLSRGRRVLLMADADEGDAVTALLFSGASGCLFWRDASPRRMLAAVREVAAGGAALHPAAAAAVLAQWRATRDAIEVAPEVPDPQPAPALSRRETEVLHALARGLPTKLIGRELSISPKTVEAHIARLLAKLGVRTRIEAVSAARERGVLKM